jgi:hypothetical protein
MERQIIAANRSCPVEHFHSDDATCGRGTPPSGAQTGPHYHIGSYSCFAESKWLPSLDACVRPHWHVNDPTFRSA